MDYFTLTSLPLPHVFQLTKFVETYIQINFPTDSDHIPCNYAANAQYPFIYFPQVGAPQKRVCVNLCPLARDIQVQCRPNSVVKSCFNIVPYDTQQEVTRLGGYCMPTDPTARQTIIDKAWLKNKISFLNAYDLLFLALAVAVGIGILWLLILLCVPSYSHVLAIVFAQVALLWLSVNMVMRQQILIGAILVIIALLLLVGFFLHLGHFKVGALFLPLSRQVLSYRPSLILIVILHIILSAGVLILFLAQYLAFESAGSLQAVPNDLYLRAANNPVLLCLNIIQALWLFQFLKDSFNFIVGGTAVDYYLQKASGWRESSFCRPLNRLISNHLGSVAAGSFTNSLLSIIAMPIESCICSRNRCCSLLEPLFFCCGCAYQNILILARTDVYSMINLTGMPYCNAARNCQSVHRNRFATSHGIFFQERVSMYLSCVGIVSLAAYYYMLKKVQGIDLHLLGLVAVVGYIGVIYWVDLLINLAEGLETSFYTEWGLDQKVCQGFRHIQIKIQQLQNVNENYC